MFLLRVKGAKWWWSFNVHYWKFFLRFPTTNMEHLEQFNQLPPNTLFFIVTKSMLLSLVQCQKWSKLCAVKKTHSGAKNAMSHAKNSTWLIWYYTCHYHPFWKRKVSWHLGFLLSQDGNFFHPRPLWFILFSTSLDVANKSAKYHYL